VCLNIHLNALGIAVANGIDKTHKEEKKTKKAIKTIPYSNFKNLNPLI
jgi:hypothetical protein